MFIDAFIDIQLDQQYQALLATIEISLLPILIILPLTFGYFPNALLKPRIMAAVLSFSIGQLLAECFLHSLPHLAESIAGHHHHHDSTMNNHNHTESHPHDHHHHDHHHNDSFLAILIGVLICYTIQRLISIFSNSTVPTTTSTALPTLTAATTTLTTSSTTTTTTTVSTPKPTRSKISSHHSNVVRDTTTRSNSKPLTRNSSKTRNKLQIDLDQEIMVPKTNRLSKTPQHSQPIASLVVINETSSATNNPPQSTTSQQSITVLALLSDFLHNLGDGLNISLAFTSGMTQHNGSRSMAMMITLHELIRSISDLSILIQHGQYSLLDAAKTQLLTASGAIIGCLIGNFAPIFLHQTILLKYLAPLTLGCFLYLTLQLLSTVGMDDNNGHHHHQHHHHSLQSTQSQSQHHEPAHNPTECISLSPDIHHLPLQFTQSLTWWSVVLSKTGQLLFDLCMIIFGIFATQTIAQH